jgi:uncharacterized protein (DUF1697 family)
MPVYIALLRGINVGGVRIKMADLREMFEELGFSEAQTLLQSGNVVFESDQTDSLAIVRTLEDGIANKFDYQIPVVLRRAEQMQILFDKYPPSKDQETKFYHLLFLKETPSSGALDALKAAYDGPESIDLRGDELYVYYSDGAGRSKLTTNLIEKHLKVKATARNWNTVEKLVVLAQSLNEE